MTIFLPLYTKHSTYRRKRFKHLSQGNKIKSTIHLWVQVRNETSQAVRCFSVVLSRDTVICNKTLYFTADVLINVQVQDWSI